MRLPARTIRVRLTLAYGLVFLATGAILLTTGYALVRHNLDVRPRVLERLHLRVVPRGDAFNDSLEGAARQAYHAAYEQYVHDGLHRLLAEYIVALLVMTGASVVFGWVLAGRALSPLRAITATAQRVSGENLGERIALDGPDDELKQLADTFDGMLARLDSAFESQRHFVANASHELRTPLAIMRTELDVALADPDASQEDLRAMGEGVRETIDRSEALIAALLELAHSETLSGREESVALHELAGDCVTDLHARARAATVEVRTDLGPAVVRGDPRLLERLLANLIDNAIRHNEPGGWLEVRTRTDGRHVNLGVRNSGAVVKPAEVESLTEPFRRLSRKAGGFGLGLSIVQAVVDAHGGSLSVHPRDGGGLQVGVQLPADQHASSRRLRGLTKASPAA